MHFPVSSGVFKTGSFGVMASHQGQLPCARAVQARSFCFFTRAAGVVGAGVWGSLPVLPLLLFFHLLWWAWFILRCDLLRTCMLYLMGKVISWPAGWFSYIQFGFLPCFHALWRLEEKESSYVKLIWILCTCVILPHWAWLALSRLWPTEFRTFRFSSVCSSTLWRLVAPVDTEQRLQCVAVRG